MDGSSQDAAWMADSTDEVPGRQTTMCDGRGFCSGILTEVAVHAGINTRSYPDAAKAQKKLPGIAA